MLPGFTQNPFPATDDLRAPGIEPIPTIVEKISAMIEKCHRKTIDIKDVEFPFRMLVSGLKQIAALIMLQRCL